MRVITGIARGRKLKEPSGLEARPTTSRVKESIFNILQFQVPGRRVLDLFAGTGQMGIEALSRGAESAVFVDQRGEAAQLIRENLALCGLKKNVRVATGDALQFLEKNRDQFDLIFVDPPYHKNLLEKAVEQIAKFDILSLHGIIVCESSAKDGQLPVLLPDCTCREYRYGSVLITMYYRNGRGVSPKAGDGPAEQGRKERCTHENSDLSGKL